MINGQKTRSKDAGEVQITHPTASKTTTQLSTQAVNWAKEEGFDEIGNMKDRLGTNEG